MGLKLTTDEARKYANRGGRKRDASDSWMVEGVLFSIDAIAQEIGTHEKLARVRLRRAQAMSGPVTWARLRGGSE